MGMDVLHIDQFDADEPCLHGGFPGKDFRECFSKFEKARIFDGLTLYEAEQEITVLYG